MALGYAILDVLPLNSFSRKSIGYLYAIQHHAKRIYDFDDDNWFIDMQSPLASFDVSSLKFFDIGSDELNVNVYSFYAETPNNTNIWPRGFPLQATKGEPEFNPKPSHKQSHVSIIQFLQDGNPDLDAVFRLSQKIPKKSATKSEKCVIIPSKGYTPFNAQATYFDSRSFFGLLLPMTVHGRVSDIWRSFVLQRILKGSGLLLAFCPSIVFHERNPHSLIRDFNAELPLYLQAHALVSFLDNLSITTAKDNMDALRAIYIELFERGVLGERDIEFVDRWVHDFRKVSSIAKTGASANQ
jgi:hypothetical protein